MSFTVWVLVGLNTVPAMFRTVANVTAWLGGAAAIRGATPAVAVEVGAGR